ncbi:MAG: hypothetical protein GF331_14105 [Chitinivibrionales bacterium]|nr:hypothetical protein [Chitinivibrionales bacterium]
MTVMNSRQYGRVSGLITHIRRHRKPVDLPIVADWSGELLRGAQRTMTLIYGAGQELARHMARFVLAKGWRRATFVLDSDHFRHTGRYCNLWDFLTMRAELLHLQPGFDWRLIVVRTTPKPSWDPLGLELPEHSLSRALSVYEPVSPGVLVDQVECVADITECLGGHAHASDCLVFQRDEYAAASLAWAREHGIRIPADVAVLSTDDAPRYYHLGLSRIEIDWDSLGVFMAHCLMHDGRLYRSTFGSPGLPIRVIEKQTT